MDSYGVVNVQHRHGSHSHNSTHATSWTKTGVYFVASAPLSKVKMDVKDKKEQKKHQHKHSGPKAQKKKNKKQGGQDTEEDARKRNPKAFAVQSAVRMARTFHRFAIFHLLALFPLNGQQTFSHFGSCF